MASSPKFVCSEGENFEIVFQSRGFNTSPVSVFKVDDAGALTVLGVTLTGTQSIVGDFALTGDMTVGDDLTVTDDVAVGGDLAVTGTLAVTSTSSFTGDITFAAGTDIVLDSAGAGTKIGTGATQKLGFWGVTPVVQYATEGTTTGQTSGTGTAVLVDDTFTGNFGTRAYTIGDIVKCLKTCGLMDKDD